MAEHSTIEWTDATWNPVTGCAIVSPGCTHCYAMKLAGTRLKHHPSRAGLTIDSKARGGEAEGRAGKKGHPVWNGQVRLNEGWLDQPLRWKRPRRIFVCAHGDLFAEGVPDEWIDRVFAVMALAPQHTFQILTKRASRMRKYLTEHDARQRARKDAVEVAGMNMVMEGIVPHAKATTWPLPNVWLGVSAERQQEADERVPELLATPAAIRFASAEPLLGPIAFTAICTGHYFIDALRGVKYHDAPEGVHSATETCARLDQIIVGGESGDGARPMHPHWPRWIRSDCADADVAFFFKQWGEWKPVNQMTDAECDGLYVPAPVHDPERTRRCRVGSAVLHEDGKRLSHDAPNAFLANTGAMSIYEVGKKKAGRLLDGVEHNGMPQAREVPAL